MRGKLIGIDGHVLGDHSGGNETYYRNLLLNLSDEVMSHTILFVDKEKDARDIGYTGRVVCFKAKNAFIRNYIEIPILAKKYSLSALHMQYFIPFIRPCPIITTIHDISFEHFDNIFTRKEMLIQKKLIPYAAQKSAYVLTVSNFSKKDICEHYHVAEDKVVVTYNGIAQEYKVNDFEESVRKEFVEKMNIPDEYVLYVGNIQPRKNLGRLLEAYVEYVKTCEEAFPLVIVGKKAWLYDSVFEVIKKNNLESKVIFTGYVKSEDLIKLYNIAKLFIYPSIFEGFGLPVLEAMACGTPVITSNSTAIPEVTDGACYLIDPFNVSEMTNSLVRLTTDENIRKELVEKGLKQSAKFSWKDTVDRTEEIYKKYL